ATQASIDKLMTTMENLIIAVVARPADGPRPPLAAAVGAHPHVRYLTPHVQYLVPHASHPTPHASHPMLHTSHPTQCAPHSAPHAPYSAQQVPHPAPCTPAYSLYSSVHGPHLSGHASYPAPPASYAPSVGVYAQAAEPPLMPPYHGPPPRPPGWHDPDPVQYREFVCFYCDGTVHRMVQCDYLLEDMRASRIVRNERACHATWTITAKRLVVTALLDTVGRVLSGVGLMAVHVATVTIPVADQAQASRRT
ncbi:hypothetical protein GGF32_008888, partial [Allomyces javanicus]